MKPVLLAVTLLPFIASSGLAQSSPDRPPRVISLPPKPAPPANEPASEANDDANRFDLKFPGGKVKEFVAAVAKALGKPVNVVIPKESEDAVIPAVEMSKVTVQALFRALSTASQHEVAFATSVNVNSVNPGGSYSISYKKIGFLFKTEEGNSSPDPVWTFQLITSPELPKLEPTLSPRTVQYYPVAEYLTHFSVEDITAAIEAGWALQGTPTNPAPTIRFHEETKLLICAGTPTQIDLVPQVLNGLSMMLRYPRTENLKITRKASQIILPKIEFREAALAEAVDFIRRRAWEADPEHQGFNIVIDDSPGPGSTPAGKITLALTDIPALEALKLVAQLSGVELEIRDQAILLKTRKDAAPPAGEATPPAQDIPPPPPRRIVHPVLPQ